MAVQEVQDDTYQLRENRIWPGAHHFLAGEFENKRGNPTEQLHQHRPHPSSPGADTWSRLQDGPAEHSADDRIEGAKRAVNNLR